MVLAAIAARTQDVSLPQVLKCGASFRARPQPSAIENPEARVRLRHACERERSWRGRGFSGHSPFVSGPVRRRNRQASVGAFCREASRVELRWIRGLGPSASGLPISGAKGR
jgi:hypothetical protein